MSCMKTHNSEVKKQLREQEKPGRQPLLQISLEAELHRKVITLKHGDKSVQESNKSRSGNTFTTACAQLMGSKGGGREPSNTIHKTIKTTTARDCLMRYLRILT
jgi:hypothetical protein